MEATTAPPAHAPRAVLAVVLAVGLSAVTVGVAAARSLDGLTDPLTFLLAGAALLGVVLAENWEGTVDVSAAFVCFMLAVAFLGPAPAMLVVIAAEVGLWVIKRYRPPALAVNVAGSLVPILVSAEVFGALAEGSERGDVQFLVALGVASIVNLVLNWYTVVTLRAVLDGLPWAAAVRPPTALVPALALTIAFTVVLAGAYATFGFGAAFFVILLVIAFGYMASLVRTARERTREYASLSWGVLSGLVRTLDRRDGRTARHSAAVAAFARDIAGQVGMGRRDQELAHTAGLLHDIGKFAFADRVLEKGSTLTEEDWADVQRHPELASDLLQDLGVYGPVAELVRGHHERIDGRGYPDGLRGDAIPPIARIVAVAEVYDTLTAEDTYRTPMTSFEALRELRRVAGSQLDVRYVEALAELLTGRDIDYRHADRADFALELAIERRIAQAVSPDGGDGRSADAG